VGCAKGFLVESLRDRGVEAYGYDVSEFAISQVRPDIRRYCWVGSLTDPIPEQYDLITCIEVLEHIPEEEARPAIRNMISHGDAVLFSSTSTDFTEPTHVNVRPLIDWLRMFAKFSFAPDTDFDASFIARHAVLLRRSALPVSDEVLRLFTRTKMQAIALYEKELLLGAVREELRQANVALDEKSATLAVSENTLQQLLNSKGWQMLERYREFRGSLRKLVRRTQVQRSEYQRWRVLHEEPPKTGVQLAQIRAELKSLSYAPKISIVMPTYNTPTEYLNNAINSVRAQYYENWELCICDDDSSAPEVRSALERWASSDNRIKIGF
jgi:hypothetical protein